MSLQDVEMRPGNKRSDMQFILSLQRYQEYVIISHLHSMDRYTRRDGTE